LTKPTESSGTADAGGGPAWRVQFATGAAKDLRGYDVDDPRFRPKLALLIEDLKRDPFAFPKKRGKLRDARAASLRFANVAWRVVFTIDEQRRLVRILSLGPHDLAYERAERRA
jgi:Txe/YoeB family toxin of Txe-Axe toxin-antitoxin module